VREIEGGLLHRLVAAKPLGMKDLGGMQVSRLRNLVLFVSDRFKPGRACLQVVEASPDGLPGFSHNELIAFLKSEQYRMMVTGGEVSGANVVLGAKHREPGINPRWSACRICSGGLRRATSTTGMAA
jgi:hypothetical protein